MKPNAWKILSALLVATLVAASCTSEADKQDTAPTTAQEPNNRVIYVNEIDPERTEYRDVSLADSSSGEAQPDCENPADETLRIGSLLPQTGVLDYLGPVQEAAIELALEDIRSAGGITGVDLDYTPADSGTARTALVSTQRHIRNDVDVIVGPPSSALTQEIVGEITGKCRIHISGGNTALGIETVEQNDMYFRTAPSDKLQGQVLADLVAESGANKVSVVAASNSYGEPLGSLTATALKAANIEANVVTYDPENVDFNSVSDGAVRGDPDAITLIGFEESQEILQELLRRDVKTTQIYLSDGNAGNALGEQFTEPDQLDGIRGVQPGADRPSAFKRGLNRLDQSLTRFDFSPETYDAVIVVALAAELAQSDSSPEIARQINGVTRDGSRCTTYTQCKKLINDGATDIDYDGISGPLKFDSDGEATVGSFSVVEFG